MPYEITISGIDTTFNKCIDWVACKVDTPSTSNAKSNYVGNYMNISGFIGTDEVTIDLYKWAILPVNDSNVFRNVQITVKDANDNVIEKVSFPNAFVEFYRESYTRDKGLGKFNLQLKQKIDKNMDIKVSDASAGETIKSAAESKILDSVLGNAPKSGILDTGGSEVGEGTGKTSISPEMEQKILYGRRQDPAKNGIAGGHSSEINNNNPNYAVEVISANKDGTKLVKYTTQFPDGNLAKIKTSTLFPDSWTNKEIIESIKSVGDTPAIGVRDNLTLHRGIINGVEIDVIKDGSIVTSGYPTGGKLTPGFNPVK